MSDVTCPYCDRPAELVDSAVIYGRSYGMVWLCRPCDARVGCHGHTDRPLGRLANAELREKRKAAHAAFDPIWQAEVKAGVRRAAARALAYKWLSEQLGIEKVDCHIAMFDEEMCVKVVEVCERRQR